VDFATDYIIFEDVGVLGGVFLRTNIKLLPTLALPIRVAFTVKRQKFTANCKNVKVHVSSTIRTR
jgi:hypothetical protein